MIFIFVTYLRKDLPNIKTCANIQFIVSYLKLYIFDTNSKERSN